MPCALRDGNLKLSGTVLKSPDAHAEGLVSSAAEALRYDQGTVAANEDPYELPGILKSWMPERARVLDVGCGTGAVTLRATHGKGNDIVGVEPDVVRAGVAQSRGLKIICGVLDEDLVATLESFDVILLSDVIEHVAAPSELLDLATRALAKEGVILASVPNVAHWTVRFGLLFGRFDYASVGIMDATHLRWFTMKSLQRLFEARGLRITDATVTAGLWMQEYKSFPLNLIPGRIRRPLVQRLTRVFPTLFGCQLVVRAVRATV